MFGVETCEIFSLFCFLLQGLGYCLLFSLCYGIGEFHIFLQHEHRVVGLVLTLMQL